MDAAASRIPSPGAELISVRIGEQAYAIDIMAVREIRGWTAATPLPATDNARNGLPATLPLQNANGKKRKRCARII